MMFSTEGKVMNAKLVAILVASHVVTLVAGLWLGFELVRRVSRFGDMEQLALSQTTASAAFKEAPGDAAREVLLRNLDLLDRLGPSALPATELAVDRLVTLTRLSKVETNAGRVEQAADYRAKAHRVCEDAKWRDCSEQAMDRLVSKH